MKIIHVNPQMRGDNEGNPVPAFENIIIVQASSTKALAVEYDSWLANYFGMECELSAHTYKDLRNPKIPDPRNFWSFLLSTP